jgi:hypothetical protein
VVPYVYCVRNISALSVLSKKKHGSNDENLSDCKVISPK